jgi:5-deoxy-D-glucuronate isomerase
MQTPEITISLVSNIWTRMMHFINAGDQEQGHMHNYDHITLLAHGKLEVEVDGLTTVFEAPNMIYINKDKKHQLTALEDNTVAYCIHALRNLDKSGDILDPSMLPKMLNSGNTAHFAELFVIR